MNKVLVIVLCLLSSLPQVMQGQTILSKYETDGWWNAIWRGKPIRTHGHNRRRNGDWYLQMNEGFAGMVDANFIDGYQFGPDVRFGHVNKDNSRLEIDLDAKWSFSRQKLAGISRLRYVMSPLRHSWIELFGGQKVLDYDEDAFMTYAHQTYVSDVFGWYGCKQLLRTMAGVKASVRAGADTQLTFGIWYERREREWDHIRKGLKPNKKTDNVPEVRDHDTENWMNDPLLNWEDEKLIRFDIGVEYTPGRTLYVVDDMTSFMKSPYPTFGIKLKSSFDHDLAQGWRSLHCASLDLSVKYEPQWRLCDDEWRYEAHAGFFPVSRLVNLADMRHFDASVFPWQVSDGLTWFSLLGNYELSTDRSWIEAHGEYSSENMLLTLFSADHALREYVQLHAVKTYGQVPHTEVSYGLDLNRVMRIGCSVGFDNLRYDGIGFNLWYKI